MARLLVEFVVRSILIAAGTGAVLWAVRIKTAAARHSAWTGVLLLMLLLPMWTPWGPKAALRLLPPVPAQTQTVELHPAGSSTYSALPTGMMPGEMTTSATPSGWKWEALFISIYFLGAGALLFRLLIGTIRTYQLIGRTSYQDGKLTSSSFASPITVGWFNPVVILPGYWQEWSESQLDAVLTHEREHVRRRDPLVQWLALLNRAVFWFHPLAWWLERRLSALAEEACDVAVLVRGHAPQDYSEYLLDIARSIMQSGRSVNVVGMAMPGKFLPQRIHRIFDGIAVPRISRSRVTFAVAACAISSIAFASGTLERISERPHSINRQPSQTTVTLPVVSPVSSLASSPVVPLRIAPEPMSSITPTPQSNATVFVLGEVIRPGNYPLKEGRKLTVLEVLVMAGGITSNGNPTDITLIRMLADGSRSETHIDLHGVPSGQSKNVELVPGDTVFVPQRETFSAPESVSFQQKHEVTAATTLAFEVASVKSNSSGDNGGTIVGCNGIDTGDKVAPVGRCIARNAPLKLLLALAYGIPVGQRDLLITGGPGWLGSDRFDIEAKSEPPATEERLHLMLQTLLAERFKLAVHHEVRPMSDYALLQEQNGAKLKKSEGDGPAQVSRGPGGINAKMMSMPELTDQLSRDISIPVVDMTELKGRYDFQLNIAAHMQEAQRTVGEGQRPDVFDVMQQVLKDLGLKLESRKLPIQFLVIDHAEKPPLN